MTGSNITYPEGLEVIHGERITIQVEQRVLQHASVTVSARATSQQELVVLRDSSSKDLREDKSVSIEPFRILGVEPHELVPKNMGHRSHTPTNCQRRRVWLFSPFEISTDRTHIGAPGWPELALKVASAYSDARVSS